MKKIKVIVMIVTILCGTFLLVGGIRYYISTLSPEDLYTKAMELLPKDFSKASVRFILILERFPESEYATKSFDQLVKWYDSHEAHLMSVDLYQYAQKVKLTDDSLFLVAASYVIAKDYVKATEIFPLINIDVLDEKYHYAYYYLLTTSYYVTGQVDQAKKYEGLFTTLYPEDFTIYPVVGAFHMKNGDYEIALHYILEFCTNIFTKKDVFSGSELITLVHFQKFLIDQERYDEAYTCLVKMSYLMTENLSFYYEYIYEYGRAAFYKNEHSIAMSLFTKVVANSRDLTLIENAKSYLKQME